MSKDNSLSKFIIGEVTTPTAKDDYPFVICQECGVEIGADEDGAPPIDWHYDPDRDERVCPKCLIRDNKPSTNREAVELKLSDFWTELNMDMESLKTDGWSDDEWAEVLEMSLKKYASQILALFPEPKVLSNEEIDNLDLAIPDMGTQVERRRALVRRTIQAVSQATVNKNKGE